MKRFFKSAILIIIIILLVNSIIPYTKALAGNQYITVDDFADWLVPRIKNVAFDFDDSIDYLLQIGIIKEGDFKSYDEFITRGDALVLLNRSDEYLFGDTVEEKLLYVVIEERISDIKEIDESKREDIAKGYIKGFMKGYSNGSYSTDRYLKLKKKITYETALSCANMLRNKYERAKVGPDGQLLNTIDSPKFAYKYPFTLASYPDSYYDNPFKYYGPGKYEVGRDIPSGEYVIYSINNNAYNDHAYFEINKKSNWVYSGILINGAACPNVVNLKKGTYLYLRDSYAVSMKNADVYRGYEGVYKVGEQIKPGTYILQRSPFHVYVTYVIWSNIDSDESIKNNTVKAYEFICDGKHDITSITLKKGQYVQFSGCYIADLYYYGISNKQIVKDTVGIYLYNIKSVKLNGDKIFDANMDSDQGRVMTGHSKNVPLNYAYNYYLVISDAGEYTLELVGTQGEKKKVTFTIVK